MTETVNKNNNKWIGVSSTVNIVRKHYAQVEAVGYFIPGSVWDALNGISCRRKIQNLVRIVYDIDAFRNNIELNRRMTE